MVKIAFANQKGGVGKTTLLMCFAHHLLKSGHAPLCVDMDGQRSLYGQWMSRNSVDDNELGIHVVPCEIRAASGLLEKLGDQRGIVLLDLPGSMDDENLEDVLREMDYIICPFLYEPKSFESTLIFGQTVQLLGIDAKIIFVPNFVKSNVRYDLVQGVGEEFETLGSISPPVHDRIDMQRIEFFSLSSVIQENTYPYVRYLYDKMT